MLAYIKLLRPANCLLAVLGVVAGGFLVLKTINFPLLLAFLVAFIITAAGNAMNDYFDLEADKINKPKRPLPAGKISPRAALVFSIILFGIGISLTLWLNWLCLLIVLVNSLLLFLYSFRLQNKIFLGNGIISYLVGSTFLFGGTAAGNPILPFFLMLLAMFANFSREIVKDLEDLEGDKKSFLKRFISDVKISLAERFSITTKGVRMRYKIKYAASLAISSLILAILLSPLPYLLKILSFSYLIPLLIADLIFAISCYKLLRGGKYSVVSKLIKIGMIFGLLAFFVGILI